ncbi:MAG: ATP-dependent DNA helicase RecG [Candidatus Zixiibacteriota bacterium]
MLSRQSDEHDGLWTKPVTYLKGVGPRRAQFLATQGIETTADLLLHLPRRYLDRSNVVPIGSAPAEETVTVIGRVMATGILKGRKSRFEAILSDGSGQISLLWFAGWRYLEKSIKKGAILAASGNVTWYLGRERQIVHPEFEFLEDKDIEDLTHTARVIPLYPSGEGWRAIGLESRALRRIIKPVIDGALANLVDYLDDDMRASLALPALSAALAQVHFPDTLAGAERARARLVFDEFFFLELALARRRVLIDRGHDGRACSSVGRWARQIVDHLPWTLTAAQKRVTGEITADLRSERAMRRLLQGDVGSGKTIVAALALAQWAEAGAQSALLVPTEILAEQHHHTLTTLMAPAGIDPVLLTGSLPTREKKAVTDQVRSGQARVIVGTHALLTSGVDFADLALVVIDEQHRFGVAQREQLVAKGRRPDLLVMTATPIPRTLAMTLYGDLDVSILDELPPRKGTVRTVWRTEEARDKIYQYISDTTAAGNLVYIVYPLVEQSEKLDLKAATAGYDDLARRFTDRRVALVHGRTPARDRAEIMSRFYGGELDVLVSTTVIEVGVDAPDARLMVIENAERFGLSQLHQLRGRIGRGPGQSICVLMLGGPAGPVATERVETMCRTSDGFEIAEVDLRLRGPGEFLGTRQHGIPEFKIAHLVRDAALLEPARRMAFAIAAEDDAMRNRPQRRGLWAEWKRRFGPRERLLAGG